MTPTNKLQTLATAFAGYGIFVGWITGIFAVMLAIAALFSSGPEAAELWLGAGITLTAGVVAAVPYLVTGLGLRRRARWAWIAGVVLGLLSAGNLPIGTALGGLALLTLTDADVKAQLV